MIILVKNVLEKQVELTDLGREQAANIVFPNVKKIQDERLREFNEVYFTMKELVPNWWGYDKFENEKEQ